MINPQLLSPGYTWHMNLATHRKTYLACFLDGHGWIVKYCRGAFRTATLARERAQKVYDRWLSQYAAWCALSLEVQARIRPDIFPGMTADGETLPAALEAKS